MKNITIKNTFVSASGGMAAINILGPHTNINYNIVGSDTRSFDLPSAIYSIKEVGSSGGTLDLAVDNGTSLLLNDSATGPSLLIINSFIV